MVDWIELPHWPVFNLADSAIVCGGAIAVLLAARGLQLDGTRSAGDATDPVAADKDGNEDGNEDGNGNGTAQQDAPPPPDRKS